VTRALPRRAHWDSRCSRPRVRLRSTTLVFDGWKSSNQLKAEADALDVELFKLAGVPVDLREGELSAQPFAVTIVGFNVDRLGEQERIVELVEPLLSAASEWSVRAMPRNRLSRTHLNP
jgi:hypothetical protein